VQGFCDSSQETGRRVRQLCIWLARCAVAYRRPPKDGQPAQMVAHNSTAMLGAANNGQSKEHAVFRSA